MNNPPLVGIGLKLKYYQRIIAQKPTIDWVEVHSENFLVAGGKTLKNLSSIREHYPVSLHGIGLSLGSSEGISDQHLLKLKELINIVEPFLVSEHLSWNNFNNLYLPDLLPIPYTKESLDIFCKNVDKAQNFLGRELLIENPSSYIEYDISTMREENFLTLIAQKTGAKILLDINNVFVSAFNHRFDPISYIDSIPNGLVREIHLAGHQEEQLGDEEVIKIDSHDSLVSQEVWNLYKIALEKFGNLPTLIEWDSNIPVLEILVNEALKIHKYNSLVA